jgi:hypothetical protein
MISVFLLLPRPLELLSRSSSPALFFGPCRSVLVGLGLTLCSSSSPFSSVSSLSIFVLVGSVLFSSPHLWVPRCSLPESLCRSSFQSSSWAILILFLSLLSSSSGSCTPVLTRCLPAARHLCVIGGGELIHLGSMRSRFLLVLLLRIELAARSSFSCPPSALLHVHSSVNSSPLHFLSSRSCPLICLLPHLTRGELLEVVELLVFVLSLVLKWVF